MMFRWPMMMGFAVLGLFLVNDLPGGKTVWMDCVEDTLHIVKAPANQRPARLLSL